MRDRAVGTAWLCGWTHGRRGRWGKQEDQQAAGEAQEPEQPVEKPNFGLSGALAKDQATGNVQNGVVMKWSEPPEARPPSKRYRLYVFKDDKLIGAC